MPSLGYVYFLQRVVSACIIVWVVFVILLLCSNINPIYIFFWGGVCCFEVFLLNYSFFNLVVSKLLQVFFFSLSKVFVQLFFFAICFLFPSGVTLRSGNEYDVGFKARIKHDCMLCFPVDNVR